MQDFGIVDKMRRFDPEEIDLPAVVRALQRRLEAAIEGPVVSRTRMRRAVAQQVECSPLEAEQLIDTMITGGLLLSTETSGGLTVWRFGAQA